MPAATTRERPTWPAIVGVAMLIAACASPARGEEGGSGTRATWTPSDAHDNLIVHLAFSPDGRILATAG